jgi:3-phosphoshikimate 1-carboxyvinyltransferase
MDVLNIKPVKTAQGIVRLPGSKSISNRALLLAAVCDEPTRIRRLLDSEDTQVMRNALSQLDIPMQWSTDWTEVTLIGGGGQLSKSLGNEELPIFLGNAGTVARPLTAMLAVLGGKFYLHGVPRMHERPIGDLVDVLRLWGVDIQYLGQAGFPPLRLSSEPDLLKVPERFSIKGKTSSQFVSAVLMAMPWVTQQNRISLVVEGELISRPYVDMTIRLMKDFGVVVSEVEPQVFCIEQDAKYQSPGEYVVEGDASSASYFLVLSALASSPDWPIRIQGVGSRSIQGDIGLVDAMRQMGVVVDMSADEMWAYRVDWENGALSAIDWDCTDIPDSAMTLAMLTLFAKGDSRLRGVGSWRVKETDRLLAMATELKKLGARVEIVGDDLMISPPQHVPNSAQIHTYEDHRMAMCFSLGAILGMEIHIENPACVAKTFPSYFEVFDRLTQ